MRAAVQSALLNWNMTGSTLVYNNPVYTSSWMLYSFTGRMANFASFGLPTSDPGYSLSVDQQPTHSLGSMLFNQAFSWVDASQNLPSGIADTATIAVHEAGHHNGMSHYWDCATPPTAAELASVMNTINTGTRRNLNSDDIAYQTSEY